MCNACTCLHGLLIDYIATVGMGTMFVSLHNSFQTKDYRVFRASLFAGLGLTGIVPIIHGWYLNYEIAAVHRALGLDVIMGVTYLVGACRPAACAALLRLFRKAWCWHSVECLQTCCNCYVGALNKALLLALNLYVLLADMWMYMSYINTMLGIDVCKLQLATDATE